MTVNLDRAISSVVPKWNRIVNGGMQISQENGAAVVTTSTGYPVEDMYVFNSSTATFSAQQVASLTPGGSSFRTRLTITGGVAPASSHALVLRRKLEGFRIADLLFGMAAAKYVTFQMGFRSSIAGTFSVTFFNAAVNRVYAGQVVVAAGEINTDLVRTITFQVDQSGTWLRDIGIGCYIDICFGCHADTTRAPNVWGAPAGYYSNQQTNGLVTGAVYEVFDMGLYEGNSAPAFVPNSYDFDLRECQRYYETYTFVVRSFTSGVGAYWWMPFCTPKRTTPTTGLINITYSQASGAATLSPNIEGCELSYSASGNGGGSYIVATLVSNARL